MDFFSSQLLTLASLAGAETIFTPARAGAVLDAAFDLDRVEVSSVDLVTARATNVAPQSPREVTADLRLWPPGEGNAWMGQATFREPTDGPSFDAEVRLRLSTSSRSANTTVTDVRTADASDAFNMAGIDARIIADDGALPSTAVDLETRRREALFALLHDRFDVPGDWQESSFWEAQGGGTVADVVERYRTPTHPLAVSLDLVIDPDVSPRSVDFTFDLGVIIAEDPFVQLRTVLERVRAARGSSSVSSIHPAPPSGAALRSPVPVAVLMPESALDDADLPTDDPSAGNDAARRAARLREINTRFSTSGVAFVAVP